MNAVRLLVMGGMILGSVHAPDAFADASLIEPGPAGTIKLTVKVHGKHTAGMAGGSAFPFKLEGEAKFHSSVLMKGGADALKAIFGGLSDKSNGSDGSDKITGDLKIGNGKITGRVRYEWDVQGNTMFFETDLTGTISSKSVNLSSKDGKAGGSWNWGGGVAELEGTIEIFSVELVPQGASQPK